MRAGGAGCIVNAAVALEGVAVEHTSLAESGSVETMPAETVGFPGVTLVSPGCCGACTAVEPWAPVLRC
jgi:hypothetical protein